MVSLCFQHGSRNVLVPVPVILLLESIERPPLCLGRAASEHEGHKGRQIHLGSFPEAQPAAE